VGVNCIPGTGTPVPLNPAVCTAPATFPLLSVTVKVPARLPPSVGVNVTVIRQLPPAATLPTQFVLALKSPLPVTELIAPTTFPLFDTVTVWLVLAPRLTLPRFALAGLNPITGSNPIPLNPTLCADPAIPPVLSVTTKLAVRDPCAVGLNVTVTAQLPPAATLPPQLFVALKSPAFAPPVPIELIVSAALPPFVTVTPWPPLADPTF
jgi:hypothetical protein